MVLCSAGFEKILICYLENILGGRKQILSESNKELHADFVCGRKEGEAPSNKKKKQKTRLVFCRRNLLYSNCRRSPCAERRHTKKGK